MLTINRRSIAAIAINVTINGHTIKGHTIAAPTADVVNAAAEILDDFFASTGQNNIATEYWAGVARGVGGDPARFVAAAATTGDNHIRYDKGQFH